MRTSCPDCGKMMIFCSPNPKSREKRRRCVACRKTWTMREIEQAAERIESEAKIEKEREIATQALLNTSE